MFCQQFMTPFIKWPSQWAELWCHSWHNVNTQAELRAVWPQWFRHATSWPLWRFSLHYQTNWCWMEKKKCKISCLYLNCQILYIKEIMQLKWNPKSISHKSVSTLMRTFRPFRSHPWSYCCPNNMPKSNNWNHNHLKP